METDFSEITKKFFSAFLELQDQANQQANKQSQQEQMLMEILNLIKSTITHQSPIVVPTDQSEEANTPQTLSAGSPTRAAGHC